MLHPPWCFQEQKTSQTAWRAIKISPARAFYCHLEVGLNPVFALFLAPQLRLKVFAAVVVIVKPRTSGPRVPNSVYPVLVLSRRSVVLLLCTLARRLVTAAWLL